MLRIAVVVAASLVFVSCDREAGKQLETLATLQRKLHGTWKGSGPCDGEFTLQADGAYERMHFSPGNDDCAGSWHVRWDALPPTLVLSCKTSSDPDFADKTSEVKLTQLNDAAFEFQHPGGAPARYTRVNK